MPFSPFFHSLSKSLSKHAAVLKSKKKHVADMSGNFFLVVFGYGTAEQIQFLLESVKLRGAAAYFV